MPKKKEETRESQITPAAEEGPYYKSGSPPTAKLFQPGVEGEKLVLSGRVMDSKGQPVPHAWLDFWQADGKGAYDNDGFRLRGHQYANSAGQYKVETVLPGSYPGRTPHIHVKVRAAAGAPILTTQLFIPGLPTNKTDFIYLDALQMELKEGEAGKEARFDFRLPG